MFCRTALLIPLFFTLLFSQILDTIIRFPEPVDKLFLASELNKIYIEGRSGDFYVLNCSTMTVQTRIPFGAIGETGENYPTWCSQHKKLYHGVIDRSALVVVDGLTDSIIRILDYVKVGIGSPHPIAYNRIADKIYVSVAGSRISVIDCTTDTVIKTITPVNYTPGGFALWDSIGNKVYIGSTGWTNADRVFVIDCQTDSVIKVIRTRISWPGVAVYSPLSRKLYVGSVEYVRGVAVIDCKYDTVIKRFNNIWSDFEYVPVYAPEVNKVYWASEGNPGDTIFVIDCDTDSIVRIIDKPLGDCIGVDCGGAYAEWSNRVYFTMGIDTMSIVAVFDCETDSLIGYTRLTHTDYWAEGIVCNPVDRKIYVSVYWDSAIYVFKDSLQGIAEEQITLQVSQSSVPTFISNLLLLPESGMGENQKAVLMDVTGRRVLDLKPGANDVRSLAPGVYFIRNQARNSKVTRFVIIR